MPLFTMLQWEVDKAVSSAEHYRTHSSVLCHVAKSRVVHISENKTQYVTHIYIHVSDGSVVAPKAIIYENI